MSGFFFQLHNVANMICKTPLIKPDASINIFIYMCDQAINSHLKAAFPLRVSESNGPVSMKGRNYKKNTWHMKLWLDQIFLDKQEAFIYMVIWRVRGNLILFVHNQISTIYVYMYD